MSRKNHIRVDGMLIQADKKFSALKERQKTRIAEWCYEGFKKYYLDSGDFPDRKGPKKQAQSNLSMTKAKNFKNIFLTIVTATFWNSFGNKSRKDACLP